MKAVSNKQIGERLRILREQRGLSLRQAAEMLGYSRSQVSNLERGVSTISAEQLFHFSSTYNMPLEYFCEGFEGFSAMKSEYIPQFMALSQLDNDFCECAHKMISLLLTIQKTVR